MLICFILNENLLRGLAFLSLTIGRFLVSFFYTILNQMLLRFFKMIHPGASSQAYETSKMEFLLRNKPLTILKKKSS